MNKPSSMSTRTGRYTQGGVSVVNEKSVGWWERDLSLSKEADDDIVIESLPLVYEGRPDLLSFDFYDDNNLEWVILQANSIVDVNEEFVEGAKIRIPSKERLFTSIITRMSVKDSKRV